MTLDILHFIDNKGGNAEEIRESQRKRGHSVELVDEIIAMYAEWVKSTLLYFGVLKSTHFLVS
jgi:seryl-tRNA synthetase